MFYLFIFLPSMDIQQKKGHMATESKPTDMTRKTPNIFYVIWIGGFISFPYAKIVILCIWVSYSETEEQLSPFWIEDLWASSVKFLMEQFYHLCPAWISLVLHLLIFFLNKQRLLNAILKPTVLRTWIAQDFINQI